MAPPAASARRRENARARRGEAREAIVAATAALMDDRPFRELTVEDVMAAAGLSRTVFYRHFDGLPEVVLALLERIEAEVAAELLEGEPGEDWLADVLAAAVDMFAEHGRFLRALNAAAGSDAEIESAYCAFLERWVQETGNAFGGGERAIELARALHLMNGHYLMETLGRDPGFDRELALSTLLTVWRGAVPQAATPRSTPS
jgi:TetR/AcrR family transcriptional regulator, ethionamide resistance regulator